MANLTQAAAGELYGQNSLEQQAVRKAWAGVGIEIVPANTTNPGCMSGLARLFAKG